MKILTAKSKKPAKNTQWSDRIWIATFDPTCAYACRDTVTGCWTVVMRVPVGNSHHADMAMATHSPLLYATNDPFPHTLAWCISAHCEGEAISKLEKLWESYAVGRNALAEIEAPPTAVIDKEEIPNTTSLIDEDSYIPNFNGDYFSDVTETKSSRYGLFLLLACTVVPIGFSFFRFLPLPQSLVSKFYAYLINPALFGNKQAVPVLRLTIEKGIVSWVGNRASVLSFANLCLAILYSSRNNILLYLTNWSHSTFLLIRRWIAFICTLRRVYIQQYGCKSDEAGVLDLGYCCDDGFVHHDILLILSIRRRMYEIFIATHVVLAMLSMIGCLLYIYYRFTSQWGYQTWIYIAFAIWGFGRGLARPLRIARNGFKRAYVTAIDNYYLKVYIPGVEASGQVYLYFPTLTWRIWDSHPFSVASGCGRESLDVGVFHCSESANEVSTPSNFGPKEGARVDHMTPSLAYPDIILIAGGVSITAVLPLVDSGNTIFAQVGTFKLFWGGRTEPLVHSVQILIGHRNSGASGKSSWDRVNVAVSIGERFNIWQVLEAEFVCGPPGMADDVRAAVSRLGKNGAVVRLSEENFS
ncbi:hypothetical protein BCR34DRAFT_650847 [Clohesyomyces aquaticus]|uniref:Ferric oxidoreductase domain-containing protein n=1 Tax=Clohesyomyces aquaticus TaxID=1231657 RepID=A0A1Y2A8I3_9PLEO|nr:hypothetical protein BCR34DRAFT_650847 [Clohesyomyces aquaticus]